MSIQKICIIGSGNLATALGDRLSKNLNNEVTLLSIEEDVVRSINENQNNPIYFPNISLNPKLKATTDKQVLLTSDFIFVAIPSNVVISYFEQYKELISPTAIIINLAKGFGKNSSQTLTTLLAEIIPNTITTLKGPSFAREILNAMPTSMTLGAESKSTFDKIEQLFAKTHFFLDYSDDLEAVELLSILKNIYAIAIGIVDAHYNSPNIRFFILTKAFNEMRQVLIYNNLKEETIFNYCGFGDFTLTALNDLSRNRTLGLLIGKGFLTQSISNNVLLEGQIAVIVFCEKRHSLKEIESRFPIISELYRIFSTNKYSFSDFAKKVIC